MKRAFLLCLLVGIVFAISATAATAAAGCRRARCCCCCSPCEARCPVEQAAEVEPPTLVEQPTRTDPTVEVDASPPMLAAEPAFRVAENTTTAVTEQDDYWYDGETQQYHKYHFGDRSETEEAVKTVLSQPDDELDRGIGTGEQPPVHVAQSAEVEVVPGEDSPEPAVVVEQTPETEANSASTQDSAAVAGDAAREQSEGTNGGFLPRADDAPATGRDELADLFDEVFGDGQRAMKPDAAAALTAPAEEAARDADILSPESPSAMSTHMFEAPLERLDVTEESAEATALENEKLDRQALLSCDVILDELGTALQDLRRHLSTMTAETVAEVPAGASDTQTK